MRLCSREFLRGDALETGGVRCRCRGGVAGLTTAVVLAEAGASVHVIAERVPGVTSLAAGAIWGPYLVERKDKVDQWGQRYLAGRRGR